MNNNSSSPPKVFISYSWDNEEHKQWVAKLAERLRENGADVSLDKWNLQPGDQLPEFMEKSIRESEFVLVICTPKYKTKSDERSGGVGYEGDIITGELFQKGNQRKFIPLLRGENLGDSTPSWALGKYYIDMRGNPYKEDSYKDLLVTIHKMNTSLPKIGSVPEIEHFCILKEDFEIPEEIKIMGVIADEVTLPRNDGSVGCALYKIPFKLSSTPSYHWNRFFKDAWDYPSRYSAMHRPGIASVGGDKIILNGTTIEEVEQFHRETLKLAVEKANQLEKERILREIENKKQTELKRREHLNKVKEFSEKITF